MVFNSLTFVVFFACVLGLHSLPLPWTTKKINLLIASYLFYAAWNPPFVILLWVSTVVDWYAAQGLVKARRESARHAWMLLSVIANLGMLGYFKYGQFLLDNFRALVAVLGIDYHPAHYDIVLPVGISFYTFATMSYTLDVYLRRAAPARNLLDYLWAIQRQRIDTGEGNATVLVGASRVHYDLQLPVWERLNGQRPIQLSFEGTSPLTYLEDLAADPKFVGRVLVGVEPDLFFSGFEYRGGAVRYTHKESPSQYIGQQLSMHLIEPYLAFDDPDFALNTVLERQPWPERPGKHVYLEPRKLGFHETDRNSYVWDKVADDPEYRELWHRIWREGFQPSPDDPTPEEALKTEKEQIARAARVVTKLRARGVKVLFVRMPSSGEYLAYENRDFPRARTWAALLTAAGAPGIHFEDYPELQGYQLPDWSHMTHSEAERFTAALYGVVMHDFWGPGAMSSSDAAATKTASRGSR